MYVSYCIHDKHGGVILGLLRLRLEQSLKHTFLDAEMSHCGIKKSFQEYKKTHEYTWVFFYLKTFGEYLN